MNSIRILLEQIGIRAEDRGSKAERSRRRSLGDHSTERPTQAHPRVSHDPLAEPGGRPAGQRA